MGAWIMAGITFREAARKKILWTALLAGAGFLIVFGIGLHFQVGDFKNSAVPPFLRYQVVSAMLMIGLYTVDLLAVVMTTLTSVDTIAGEITSGTIHAIATKPMDRWQILIGKWLGFVAMAARVRGADLRRNDCRGILHWRRAGAASVQRRAAGVSWNASWRCRSRSCSAPGFPRSPAASLHWGCLGVAFLGGWLEQMSGFTEGSRLAMVGIISSLIMPSEAVWRRAAFEMESPLSGSLQFSPFSDISIPSGAMIGYAIVYLLIALGIAVYHFRERDL